MDLQTLIGTFLSFLNDSVVPFILAIAFVIFIWNATHYFIIGGGNPESQEKARSLATWGIAAFVLIVSLWGVINFIVGALSIGDTHSVPLDYRCAKDETYDNGYCRGAVDSLDNYRYLEPVDTSNFRSPVMES